MIDCFLVSYRRYLKNNFNFVIVIILVEVVLLLVIVWVFVGFFNTMFRGFAPLVFSRDKAIDLILGVIKPRPNQVIYELGSGSARFLQKVEKRFLDVKLIGLEYSFFTFLFSGLFLWLKNSKIKIVRQNMFKANLKEADFIYCYLFPSMMPKLGEKVKFECKSGTLLISYMFSIPGWEPKQTIRQGNDLVYFYEV